MRHLRLGGESPHGYVPEMVGVTNLHMNEEVVGSGHVIEGNDLREVLGVLTKSSYLGRLVTMEPHCDHRLQTHTAKRRIDIGVEAAKDTVLLETPDSLRARRLGNAHPSGNFLVR